MHPTTHARWPRVFAGLVLAAGLAGSAVNGQPKAPIDVKPPDIQVTKDGSLIIPLGWTVLFDPKLTEPPTDILVNPEGVLQFERPAKFPGPIKLFGRNPGVAQLKFMLKDGTSRVFNVFVVQDYEVAKAALRRSFADLNELIKRSFPTANVTASVEFTPGGGIPLIPNGPGYIVILSGYVTTPPDAENIYRLVSSMIPGLSAAASATSNTGNSNTTTNINLGAGGATGQGGTTQNPNIINTIQVGGVQQVQIDVVIASVDRNEIRSRGFDFNVNTRPVQFSSVLSGLLTPAAPGGGDFSFATFGNANLQLGLVPAQFFAALQALRTEGLTKFLAEPRIVTQTGRPASFRSGGQQATVGESSGVSGAGAQLVPFGTTLEVLPIVYGNGQIWLEISPSVTAVSFANGIVINGGATPGFTEQSVRCSVMLESGQTFAIGGLIQNSVQSTASRVPVLGDVPFLGTLFSSVRHEERETELVILVTPRLVAAMDCNQVPRRLPGRETRSPDDYELFLEGIIEAPRGQRKVWNGRCYNAAYKCDPSVANFPCVGNVCAGPTGTSCGTSGCVAPAGQVIAGRAAGFPLPTPSGPPSQVPVNLPPTLEPMAPASLPASLPMPETPTNEESPDSIPK